MLPDFLVQEITIRASGESDPFACTEHLEHSLLLTLCIAHAVEHESLEVEIFGSADGIHWPSKHLKTFPEKSYCGCYDLTLPPSNARYLKAVWRASRWDRSESKPFFRFHVYIQHAHKRVMAGAA